MTSGHLKVPLLFREDTKIPAKSKAQARFMFAEMGRKKKGKKTETGMSEDQLKDFTKTKQKGLPEKIKKTKKGKK